MTDTTTAAPAAVRPRGPCKGGPDDPCAALALADGRRLPVLPLHRGDAAAEQAFVDGLSRQSRYRRFHAGLPALPASLLNRLVDVDQQAHVALAAWAPRQDLIVADARYVRDGQRGAAGEGAEFALTVADDWQGLGLGRRLLVRLARHAQSQGLQHLHGSVLWDNRPMIGLVERLGGTLRTQRDDPGIVQAFFQTAALAG
jgi:acetyltransferase